MAACVLGAALLGLAPLAARADDQPPDSWITLKSQIAVWTAVGLPGADINVDTVRGFLTLHGAVASSEDRSKAERAARTVPGVTGVRNLLQVVPARKKDRVQTSDDRIHSMVATAIEEDDLLKDSRIRVQSVNKGAVLLAGRAKSLSAHLHALEIAKRVGGVRSVHSEISSDDARADRAAWRLYEALAEQRERRRGVTTVFRDLYITSATKVQLLANRETPGFRINVDTDNGVVTLFGTVQSREAKRTAELNAQQVAGVKQVVNRLEVEMVR
jgi:hyperosmotically inducible protein